MCLNHSLKIWNLATNKLVATKDLLGRPLQEHETASYSLNPSETAFIRVFNAERSLDGGHRYYIVTYSPHDNGCFKFWAVKGGLTSQLVIEDLYPDSVLRPMDPDTTGNMFWSVIDFDVKPMDQGERMEFWVLWRNNSLYQLYTLHFDFQTLVSDWSNKWVATAMETRTQEPPPCLVPSDVVDPTERWLKYLLQPGRFLPEVLDTALAVYQEAFRPLSLPGAVNKNASLEERLCSTIAATVSLRKYAEENMDFARYRIDTDAKWRQFWQVAEDINRKRFEPISLVYDSYYEVPWVLLSDSCAVIRECSSTELLLHNSGPELSTEISKVVERWNHRDLASELGDSFEQASHIAHVASGFRQRFSPELQAACQAALEAELFTDPSSSIPDRMEIFRERCDFTEQISNATYDSVCAAINEHLNIYNLPHEAFEAIIDTVPLKFNGPDSDLLATHFGVSVTVDGVQETLLQTRQSLIDLLLLVVFLDGEIEQEDGSNFDATHLFPNLISYLKEYEMMSWLSCKVRKCVDSSTKPDDSESSLPMKTATGNGKDGLLRPILKDLFGTDIKPRQAVNSPQTHTLTLAISDLLCWVTHPGAVTYPNALAYIQCELIANGDIDLAWDFLRFQASTPWATYVKGRLYIAMSEFETAAIYFKKAAYNLCKIICRILLL